MKSSFKSLLILSLVLPINSYVFSQKKTNQTEIENLVENGSFESTGGKVKKLSQIDMAIGWSSPTGVRADLFVDDKKVPEICTPTNIYGTEEPKEGSNYAGILAYSYNDKMPRSYATSKLKTPLKKGTKYCVSFNVSLAECSKYSSNNIGAILTKKSYSTDAKVSIIEKPNIVHYDNETKVFNAFYNWEKICGMYTAEGGEKFIMLGNFADNNVTKQERNKPPKDSKTPIVIGAYYYIDDVSVTILEEGKQCECSNPKDDDDGSSTIYQRPFIMKDNMDDKQKVEAQASFFAFGKTRLQPEALRSLDLIAETMKSNPKMKIEINGFVDSNEVARVESNPLFEGLDQKRAEAAFKFLIEKGIEEQRISIKAMGYVEENELFLETDEPELKAAKRRRITFKIID